MVVAPRLDHGMIGKFECRDGYMLKGHNTTQCFFGNWTGMTPWCKEGQSGRGAPRGRKGGAKFKINI